MNRRDGSTSEGWRAVVVVRGVGGSVGKSGSPSSSPTSSGRLRLLLVAAVLLRIVPFERVASSEAPITAFAAIVLDGVVDLVVSCQVMVPSEFETACTSRGYEGGASGEGGWEAIGQ